MFEFTVIGKWPRNLACAVLMLGLCASAVTAHAEDDTTTSRPAWLRLIDKWFNPATAPFIPIPEIAVDPNNGTTLGVMPTWVHTNDAQEINRIVAADLIHNPYFGVGTHVRVYSFASSDTQWSVVAGIKQRVEREFDGSYELGRLRDTPWSANFNLVYDRDGTARYYGLGNRTVEGNETNFTSNQERAQARLGFNLNHQWQLLYTARFQSLDVQPGTLPSLPSIETRFPGILGTDKRFLNRLSVIYDSRDDQSVPRQGQRWEVYGGLASREGFLNESMYSECGLDGRSFWPLAEHSVLATHVALHYMPVMHDVPFWAMSNIGGDKTDYSQEPSRGYGEGRFYGRNAFSSTIEFRQAVKSFSGNAANFDLELTPFIDAGRVFERMDTLPLKHLHYVGGIGIRGVARPFVVGFIDVGYGSEGTAVFTGINYPF